MFKDFSWWKLYFWLAANVFAFGLPNLANNLSWSISSWLLFITEILSLIGLYAYAFHRSIFSARFWRVFLWSILWIWNIPVIYSFSPLKDQFFVPEFLGNYLVLNTQIFTIPLIGLFIICLILSIPTFYAVYQDGYKKKLMA